jgi:molybdopterin molybdotransferase
MAKDTFGASDSLPAMLEETESVRMGVKPQSAIESGQACYIPTGGEIPENSDSVVMVEYCENIGDDYVYINKSVAPGNGIIFKGDDIKCGETVISANHRLRPQDIGVLAALGFSKVRVKRRIRVGIIATGDELIDISDKPSGSQVRDINSYTIFSEVVSYGGQPYLYGIMNDEKAMLEATVKKAADESDIVIISGGSSVGTRDETCNVISGLSESGVLVHGIAVKPGKPTIIGKVGKKAVIGLPGHPVSAYMIFKILVLYLMDVMYGVDKSYSGYIQAKISCNYPSNNGREEFLPVRLEKTQEGILAHPVFGKSGLISTLSTADGFIRIGRGTEGIPAGRDVRVILF